MRCKAKVQKFIAGLCALILTGPAVELTAAPAGTPQITQTSPLNGDWPSTGDYQPFKCGAGNAFDPARDGSGNTSQKDFVGSSTYPAAFYFTTDNYLFVRMRVDANPVGSTAFNSSSWGVGFTTNPALPKYQYAFIVYGNGTNDTFTLHDGDGNELAQEGAYNVWARSPGATSDGSNFNGNIDYFVDVAVPLTELKNISTGGPTPFTPGVLTVWIATSSGTKLDKDFICWDNSNDPNTGPWGLAGFGPPSTIGVGSYVKITSPIASSSVGSVTPTISGTATPGGTFTISEGSNTPSTVTVDGGGNWTFTVPSAWGWSLNSNTTKIINAAFSGGTSDSVTFTLACGAGYQANANGDACDAFDFVTISNPNSGSLLVTNTPQLTGTTHPNTSVALSDDLLNGDTVTSNAGGTWAYSVPTAWNWTIGTQRTLAAVAGTATATATLTPTCATGYSAANDLLSCLPNVVSIVSPTNLSTSVTTVTPTLTGTATPGQVVTITDTHSNSATVTASGTGTWTLAVPSGWGWTFGVAQTVTASVSGASDNITLTPTCSAGYQPVGSGLACTDIDECLTANGGCNANASCTNTTGSRTCSCNVGYSGDGLTCTSTATPNATPKFSSSVSGGKFTTLEPQLSGTGAPGTQVEISDGSNSSTVTVDANGSWTFAVPASWHWTYGSTKDLVIAYAGGVTDQAQVTIGCDTFERPSADGLSCESVSRVRIQTGVDSGTLSSEDIIAQGSGRVQVCGVVGHMAGGNADSAGHSGNLPLAILMALPLVCVIPETIRRKLLHLICALVVITASSAQAIDVQTFKPFADGNRLVSVLGAEEFAPGTCRIGSFVNNANRPIQLTTVAGQRIGDIVRDLYSVDALASCGVGANLTLMGNAPLHWTSGYGLSDAKKKTSKADLGDAELLLRYTLIGRATPNSGSALAIAPYVTVPHSRSTEILGQKLSLLSEDRAVLGTLLVYDLFVGSRHYLAANLGYHNRHGQKFLNINLGPEARMGAGYSYLISASSGLHSYVEWQRRDSISAFRKNKFAAPTEIQTGLGARALDDKLAWFAGAGIGLSSGYGSPNYRAYLGFEYALRDDLKSGPQDKDANPVAPPAETLVYGALRLEARLVPSKDVKFIITRPNGRILTGNLRDNGPYFSNLAPGIHKIDIKSEHHAPVTRAFVINPNVTSVVVIRPSDDGGIAVASRVDVQPIQFETNSAVIRTQSYQDLDGIVSVMKENPGIRLMSVEGHTDNAGRRDRNLWLSSARANAVKNYLISKGVSARRLVTRGFGPDLPISTNAHSLGRARNRRVEFLLISVDGLEKP